MTGDSIPYDLRPHKAVDRRLFIDLLSRFERWHSLAHHVYISMGAYGLEDHRLVHRILGVTKLIAFDENADTVARQLFNRPIDGCKCKARTSFQVVNKLDATLTECEFDSDSNVVIWLDYTRAYDIDQQVGEFVTLLGKLTPGDVVRVTVNAQPYRESSSDAAKAEQQQKRLELLKKKIGDYLPVNTDVDSMTLDKLPHVLAGSFGQASLLGLPVATGRIFQPLSIVRYADGQQMLSITGAVIERGKEKEMLNRLEMAAWPFASTDWVTIHKLVVPHLTLRERLFLERGIMKQNPTDLIKQLGFKEAGGVSIASFLANYKKYYRFYPTLLTTEL